MRPHECTRRGSISVITQPSLYSFSLEMYFDQRPRLRLRQFRPALFLGRTALFVLLGSQLILPFYQHDLSVKPVFSRGEHGLAQKGMI